MAPLDPTTRAGVEEELRRLLHLLGCRDASVTSEGEDVNRLRLNVNAPETGPMLIGVGGAHLAALEHILHCVIRRRSLVVAVSLDVNQYRHEREQLLQERAREAAREAQTLQQSIVLEPMSASERRAVHTALSSSLTVQTESLGKDPHRRVVIRPRT